MWPPVHLQPTTTRAQARQVSTVLSCDRPFSPGPEILTRFVLVLRPNSGAHIDELHVGSELVSASCLAPTFLAMFPRSLVPDPRTSPPYSTLHTSFVSFSHLPCPPAGLSSTLLCLPHTTSYSSCLSLPFLSFSSALQRNGSHAQLRRSADCEHLPTRRASGHDWAAHFHPHN